MVPERRLEQRGIALSHAQVVLPLRRVRPKCCPLFVEGGAGWEARGPQPDCSDGAIQRSGGSGQFTSATRQQQQQQQQRRRDGHHGGSGIGHSTAVKWRSRISTCCGLDDNCPDGSTAPPSVRRPVGCAHSRRAGFPSPRALPTIAHAPAYSRTAVRATWRRRAPRGVPAAVACVPRVP
eukprot:SAG31_NODE_6899_length_1857_cov_2.766212_2_plen_178_part_01